MASVWVEHGNGEGIWKELRIYCNRNLINVIVMKNLFFVIVVIAFSLCSCNGEAKRQAEETKKKAGNDSIIAKKLKEKEMEEAKLAFEDSVAIYAWGDAKFGMTKKEVLHTKAFSGASKYDDSFSMDFDKHRTARTNRFC